MQATRVRNFLPLRPASCWRIGVLSVLAALTLTLAGDGVRAASGTGVDPFEILKLEVRPNVIIVMDSSGSMRQRITATGSDYNKPGPNNSYAAVVGDDHDSKLWNAKDVIRRVVTNNQTKVSFMFGRYTFSSSAFGPSTGPTFLYKVTCAASDTTCQTNAAAVRSSSFNNGARVYRDVTDDAFTEANGDKTYYVESNYFYDGVTLNLMSDGTCGTSPCTTTVGAPAKANPAPLRIQMYTTNNQNNKVPSGSPATFYFQGVRWNVGNDGTASCAGFHALVPLQTCTTNEQLSLFDPFLADEVPKDPATGDIVGYTPGTSTLASLTSLAGGGIKASGSTPIANSLRDIKSAFDTTLWPSRPNVNQKTFVIFITDGEDTCNYQSQFDNNDNDGTPGWARAAYQAQRLYNAGATDSTKQVPTFVIVFGGGANVANANQIAYGGSGMTAVPDANGNQYWDRTATPAEVAACTTCRTAFTASTAGDLEAAIQAALDQGVATGEFSDQQSITESVYELGPLLSPPIDPLDPDTRYDATVPVLLQSTFEMSAFAGHLKAFRNVGNTSSMIWDAGEKLCERVTGYTAKTSVSPQECDLGGVAATGPDTPANTMGASSWNFDELTGGQTPDTIGTNTTARIRRRIYTTTKNGVNASYTSTNLATSNAAATWASQVPLWPPSDAVDPARSGNSYPAGVVDGALGVTTLTAAQLAALGACEVTTDTLPVYDLTQNSHACSHTGGIQKEARQIILAFAAGAQVDFGTDSKPKRDTNGFILYKARKWMLAESTLAAPGIVSVPLENPTSVHRAEYLQYRDGPRSAAGIASNGIAFGFGMRNPDRDGQTVSRGDINLKPSMTVVYHGTNLMLHAFRAGPCPTGSACGATSGPETGGEELWAFVPFDQLGKIYLRLSRGQSRTNPIYVIASPVRFADVFVPGSFNRTIGGVPMSGSGVWRVVMLVGRGAGGKSLTAIDVTVPGPFTHQSNTSPGPIVVWNRGNPDTNDGLVKSGSNSYNNTTSAAAGAFDYAAYLKMGETWSVPAVGFVTAANNVTARKSSGVEFAAWMGSGYSDVTTEGKTFYAIDALTGDIIASHTIADRTGTPLPAQNAIVARAAGYAVRALSFYDVANAGNNAVFNPVSEPVTAVYIPDLHGRVYRFLTDTPATPPTLFRDLSTDSGDQPVANAVALMAFDSDSSGVKPHVFLEAGNDSRVPLPAASPFFRMYAERDDSGVATDVFAPIDFPQGFRGTVQPATAFNPQGKARVFYGGTRYNPTGSDCVSSFDSVIYALQGGTGQAAYDLTAGGDDRYVAITNQRINAVQTSGGQLITDFGLGAQNAPPPPAPPIVGSGGSATQSNVLMGSTLPGTVAYKRGSSVCR
jgi:hypothetical protein